MDRYLLPPIIVLIAVGIGVGYLLGYVGNDPYQQLATILSVIAIGIAIAIFVVQQKQTTEIFEINTKQNEFFEKRKKYQESQYVHALVITRFMLMKVLEKLRPMMNAGVYDYSRIKDDWEAIGQAPYDKLDDLMKTSSDVIDPKINADISMLKGQLKFKLDNLTDIGTVVVQLGGIEQIINTLLTRELNEIRLKIIQEGELEIKEAIENYIEKGYTEPQYRSMKLYNETELNKYRQPTDP